MAWNRCSRHNGEARGLARKAGLAKRADAAEYHSAELSAHGGSRPPPGNTSPFLLYNLIAEIVFRLTTI